MANSSYLLGTHAEELERLRFQHQLWLPQAQAAWQRAGLASGAHVLDVGAGPGFAAMDLARVVGPSGRVLGLELSANYVAAGRDLASAAGLTQLELRPCNLLEDAWPEEHFEQIWCRWVAMFLARLEPLLHGLEQCIAPGGQLLIHEYVHWDSFGLHPHGQAIRRFGEACQQSFRQAGGDPAGTARSQRMADRGPQAHPRPGAACIHGGPVDADVCGGLRNAAAGAGVLDQR
jgi:cyclopropane fatty-acyl-phospholipid synthase-like methyltransferase